MKCFKPNIINLCFLLMFITVLFFIHLIRGEEIPFHDAVVEIERSPELAKISNAELKFSQRLYKIFRNIEEENLIYSPLILHLSLAALKAASDGDTLNELNLASGLTKMDNGYVQNGYQDLIDMMKTDEQASIKLVNRIFTSSLFKIDGSFARILRDKLNVHINPIDFSNTTTAKERINSFIRNYTNGTIPHFIEEDSLELSSKAILLNSLYFKSAWDREFTPLNTEKGIFYTEDGQEMEVEFMNRGGFYSYAEIIELNSTALSIPYKGGRFSFTMILPERGIPFAQLEQNLEEYPMHAVLSKMSQRYIQVSVPKFTLESNIDMIGPLQLLGVKTLLSPHANMTKMSKKQGLYVNTVIQRAFISITEGGTEVSSSHFVESVPASPRFLVPFTVDRPFIFFIHDNLTNTILFAGKKLH